MKKNIMYLLAYALILQACSDPAEKTAEYLQSGKSFYAQQNYSKAKVEFKNALQIDNKLADAYYHLALIDEKDKNWKGMFSNLNQVIKLDPVQNEARLKLAKLYLLSGETENSKAQVDLVLASTADNPDAIALNGAILLKQGDNAAALAAAEKALAINPAHLDSISLKTVVYITQKDYGAAESVINQALISQPNELSLNLLKLQIHTVSRNKQAVEQDHQDLVKRFPDKPEFSYALAKYYVSEQRDQEALALLQAVVEQNAGELTPKLALIDYLEQKDKPQAEATLNKFIQTNPNEPYLYFRLANLHIQQKQFNQAKQSLNWIVEHKGKEKEGLAAKTLLAKLALQAQDISAAATLVEEVLAMDARHYDALLLKTRISLINGQNDEAIIALREILRDYPKSDEAMVLLGQAYVKKNSPELAEENFRKALNLNPGNFSAVMPVVSRMVKSEDIGRADEVLQQALAINPNHAGALQALAQVRLLKKDWLGTQTVADLIATQPKGKGFSFYLSGKISQGQGLYSNAIEKYKQALLITPGLSDALQSMMTCYETLKQRDKMFVYLDEFMLKNPDTPYPLLLKAQLYNFNKDWDKALNVLNKGTEQWPKVPNFYVLMGGIYEAKKDTLNVFESYKKGLENIPDNVQLSLLLSSAYELNKDYDKALKIYESLFIKRPDIDYAVNNLVSLLLDQYPSKENTERAVILAKRFEKSDQPYFLDTYGWALLHNSNVKDSIDVFTRVVARMPEVAVFKYHLGVANHKAGHIPQAIDALQQSLTAGAKQADFIEKLQAEALLSKLKELPETS